MELENTIEYGLDDRFMVKFLPFDASSLSLIAREFGAEFRLSQFHLVIFGESGNDDTYVTEKNVGKYAGPELSLQSTIGYIMGLNQEYTLNKFVFKLGDAHFFYDDDCLLIVSIDKNDHDSLNAILKVVQELVKLKFETSP